MIELHRTKSSTIGGVAQPLASHRTGPGDVAFYNPPLHRPEAWTEQAACVSLPAWQADIYFYPRGEHPKAAREMCGGCPVQAQCLDLGRTEKVGMFGGLSAAERSVRYGLQETA